MGSFRSLAARRAADVQTITDADRPEGVEPADWLGSGESVTFWATLPHGTVARMASAGTTAVFDTRGRSKGVTYDPGPAIRVRFAEGIIAWQLFDQDGGEVAWDPSRAADLVDGLPDAVHTYLLRAIGGGAPEPALEAPDPDAEPDAEGAVPTVGEASAAG